MPMGRVRSRTALTTASTVRPGSLGLRAKVSVHVALVQLAMKELRGSARALARPASLVPLATVRVLARMARAVTTAHRAWERVLVRRASLVPLATMSVLATTGRVVTMVRWARDRAPARRTSTGQRAPRLAPAERGPATMVRRVRGSAPASHPSMAAGPHVPR